MQTHPSPRFYLPELDGLRFIAFLLVFIHNASPILKGTFLERFSEYSWFGVDLFFCLSGFLITKLLITEHEQTGKINIRNFYIRRILRIWPLYFFYIIVGAIIIAPVEGRNVNLPWHIASLSTFTFNFAYFALLPSPILIFVHLWSISYEEQFYTVIPWVVRRYISIPRIVVLRWLIGIFILGILARSLMIVLSANPIAIYFLPFTHIDSMIGGIGLGFGVWDKFVTKLKTDHLWVIFVLCLLIVILLPNNDHLRWSLILTYPLIGAGMTLLVFLIVTNRNSNKSHFLKNNLIVYLGKISYGLYVFHFSAFTLAVILVARFNGNQQPDYPSNTLVTLMLGFLITLFFSIATYTLFEKPALLLKSKFSSIPSKPI